MTECFDPVRGSGLRITSLTDTGHVPEVISYVTSKSVIRVQVSEVIDAVKNETFKNPEGDRRLRLTKPAKTIRHTVDIDFLRVDPGVLGVVVGIVNSAYDTPGFGEGGFGEGPFGGGLGGGGGETGGFGDGPFGVFPFGDGLHTGGSADVETTIGFDVNPRVATVSSFALEVWSKLAGQRCVDGTPMWGYTLFPSLRGGRISGFRVSNGLVSFNLRGAQTRRSPKWGVGPYDLEGPFERLTSPVSRNTSWRMFTTPAAPPAEACGVQEFTPAVLDNGTAANPMPDPDAPETVDGGGAITSAWIIEGGGA